MCFLLVLNAVQKRCYTNGFLLKSVGRPSILLGLMHAYKVVHYSCTKGFLSASKSPYLVTQQPPGSLLQERHLKFLTTDQGEVYSPKGCNLFMLT